MSVIFTSSRLAFREYQPDDFSRLAELNADPKVMEFFPSTVDTGGTKDMIKRIRYWFDTDGYGWYSVERTDTGQFIGLIGFLRPRFEASFTPCVEIGWRLHQDAWGQGFATEGARACLAYGRENFGLDTVYSYTPEPNRRSERVMQKIGLQKSGTFEHPMIESGHWLRTHVLYRTP